MNRAADMIRGLYAVIDSTYIAPEDFAGTAAKIVKGGGRIIQARAKGVPHRELLPALRAARKEAAGAGALFIVNDSPEAALASGADGVHIGQADGSVKEARRALGRGAVIGVSTHNAVEARRAEQDGADYISFGPVFPTRTKKDADVPKGLAALGELAGSVSLPVVAIGGITLSTVPDVIKSGASAAVLISDILLSQDISARVFALISAINGASP